MRMLAEFSTWYNRHWCCQSSQHGHRRWWLELPALGDPWETRPETRHSRSTCEHLAHNTLVICCVRTCLWAMRQPSFVSLLGYSLHCALGQLGHATVSPVHCSWSIVAQTPPWPPQSALPCVTGRCVVALRVSTPCMVRHGRVSCLWSYNSCRTNLQLQLDDRERPSYSCMLISRMPTRQYCSDRYAL